MSVSQAQALGIGLSAQAESVRNNVMHTKWRIIPSYPDYAASNLGSIKRVTPHKNSTRAIGEIKQRVSKATGYCLVTLMKPDAAIITERSKKYRPLLVNWLVCEAFHGKCPDGKTDAAHHDGIKTNNTPSNLSWKTAAENTEDKVRHGTITQGTKCYNAKLADDVVRDIRAKRQDGWSWNRLVDYFGVSKRSIRNVCSVTSWKHV
jgi:HNH endonuclease